MLASCLLTLYNIYSHPSPLTASPVLNVSIVRSSDLVFAGESLNLSCSVSVPHNLVHSPILMWSGPGVDQNSTELSGESPLSLTFFPLHTSHGGVYTCTASLNIPETGVSVSGVGMVTIVVQSMYISLSEVITMYYT